jgi:hypothetical protein
MACDAPSNGVEDSGESEGEQEESGTGDGDGDLPTEHWCETCVDPSDGASCEANDELEQSVRFEIVSGEHSVDMDEACTVTAVSSTSIELDCETVDLNITLDLAEPWTPNLAVDESVFVAARGEDELEASYFDWRIEHADASLAVAGRQAFDVFDSLGLGAIDLVVETGLCTPSCASDVVYEQVGMTFEFEGEQATLFKGGHAVVGNREVWIADAKHLACEAFSQYGFGWANVFVSAVP